MRPLEVVPVAKLNEAFEEAQRLEQRAHEASVFAGEPAQAEQTIERLTGELETAHQQNAAFQRTIAEQQRAAAQERKEALLVEVARPKPKPKPKATA